jgi:hypothetical protein
MEREELLALLSTYLDLQPTYRKDELKTLCPFHAETQPSCYIHQHRENDLPLFRMRESWNCDINAERPRHSTGQRAR